jgi:PAS domain S-box-containing protein
MKKGIDTHFLAARQVVFWPTPEGTLDAVIGKALPLPRYVIRKAANLEVVLGVVLKSKIEVALVQVADSETVNGLRRLHAADPDLEIVLLADRAWLDPGLSAAGVLPETVDILGLPFSAAELARRVELARERRFLRRSEQRRKGSEARTSAIIKAVPSGIMSLDPDGVVHDWNPAASRMFGWSDVEALGRNFWELVGIERKPFLDEAGQLTLGKKLELTARHRSDQRFPIEMSLVSFPLGERRMLCAIVDDRS